MARTKNTSFHGTPVRNINRQLVVEASGKAPRRVPNKLKAKKSHPLGVKTKHRYRPGTVALREIKKYQKSTELLIRKLPFARFVRECLNPNSNPNPKRITGEALLILQEATEYFAVSLFEMANLSAIHAKRVSIFPKDLKISTKVCENGKGMDAKKY